LREKGQQSGEVLRPFLFGEAARDGFKFGAGPFDSIDSNGETDKLDMLHIDITSVG
jgi:hypothetical protein